MFLCQITQEGRFADELVSNEDDLDLLAEHFLRDGETAKLFEPSILNAPQLCRCVFLSAAISRHSERLFQAAMSAHSDDSYNDQSDHSHNSKDERRESSSESDRGPGSAKPADTQPPPDPEPGKDEPQNPPPIAHEDNPHDDSEGSVEIQAAPRVELPEQKRPSSSGSSSAGESPIQPRQTGGLYDRASFRFDRLGTDSHYRTTEAEPPIADQRKSHLDMVREVEGLKNQPSKVSKSCLIL